MNSRNYILFIVFILLSSIWKDVSAQNRSSYDNYSACGDTDLQPTQDEVELYRLVMAYRAQNGLPSIPYSISLTKVAKIHAKDVYLYYAEIPAGCNPHTWSGHGNWSRCDYYPDHRNAECMWSKPRELTSYIGNGYEIVHYYAPPTAGVCTPIGALEGWKKSPPHNACMINQGIWASSRWNAIGIGMYKGVACIWFGKENDPAGNYVINGNNVEASANSQSSGISATSASSSSQQYVSRQSPQYTQSRTYTSSQTSKSYAQRDAYQSKAHGQNFLSRYYDYSGKSSLSFFSAGYTYSFVDGRHLINASLLDFRIRMFGLSPFAAEFSVSPLDARVAYKPSVKLYVPVMKCMAITPYVGTAVDASYLGTLLVKGYEFQKERDFYVSLITGISLFVTAARNVPIELKVECRHPLVIPTSGVFHPQGIYLGAQIHFGRVFG